MKNTNMKKQKNYDSYLISSQPGMRKQKWRQMRKQAISEKVEAEANAKATNLILLEAEAEAEAQIWFYWKRRQKRKRPVLVFWKRNGKQ